MLRSVQRLLEPGDGCRDEVAVIRLRERARLSSGMRLPRARVRVLVGRMPLRVGSTLRQTEGFHHKQCAVYARISVLTK